MNAPRLFVTQDLIDQADIALERDQAHYIASVMRRSVGDVVRLFNGRDGEWLARIEVATRKGVILKCAERTRAQISVPDSELLFAPVKKTRTNFIIEKATELGARTIRPVMTTRTNSERVRTDRLNLIAREAAEQTERLDLPQIGNVEKLGAVLSAWENRLLIFCDEAGDATPILEAVQDRGPGPVSILIGPEGGFTSEERTQIRSIPGALPVSLGPRILRADTAAIAALTLWQSVHGDWVSFSN